jgi:hypothetical protein
LTSHVKASFCSEASVSARDAFALFFSAALQSAGAPAAVPVPSDG